MKIFHARQPPHLPHGEVSMGPPPPFVSRGPPHSYLGSRRFLVFTSDIPQEIHEMRLRKN